MCPDVGSIERCRGTKAAEEKLGQLRPNVRYCVDRISGGMQVLRNHCPENGEPGGARTRDHRIKSAMLYQLSYRPDEND